MRHGATRASDSSALIERTMAYQDAHNRHDIDAVMALCAEDIRFEIVDVWIKTGRDSLRSLEEWDAAVNGALVFDRLAATGNSVTGTAVERNDWFRLAGIDEATYDSVRLVFRQGLIAEIRAQLAPHSAQAINGVLQAAMAWAAREQPERLSQLMPKGEFVYGAQSALGWLALLSMWREARPNRTE